MVTFKDCLSYLNMLSALKYYVQKEYAALQAFHLMCLLGRIVIYSF